MPIYYAVGLLITIKLKNATNLIMLMDTFFELVST